MAIKEDLDRYGVDGVLFWLTHGQEILMTISLLKK